MLREAQRACQVQGYHLWTEKKGRSAWAFFDFHSAARIPSQDKATGVLPGERGPSGDKGAGERKRGIKKGITGGGGAGRDRNRRDGLGGREQGGTSKLLNNFVFFIIIIVHF